MKIQSPNRRSWRSFALIIGALTIVGLTSWRCGSSKKKKDTSDTPLTGNVPAVPSEWDGESDWSGSALVITDE